MTDPDRYLAKNALRLAEGRWDQVITSLTKVPQFILDPKKHFPCPMHGGKDGFRVFPDFLQTGGCICNTCGSFNNGLSWLIKLTGEDYNTVIRQVVDLLDPPDQSQESCQKEKESEAATPEPIPEETTPEKSVPGSSENPRKKAAFYLWYTISQPITYGDPASRYFASRGIMCIGRPGKDLRYGLKFCPAAQVQTSEGVQKLPAIFAAVRDSEGKLLTVHKTFLDQTWPRKAVIENPKRIAALPEGTSISGGAIYFQDINECRGTMIVAEGIETVLSVWFHYGCIYPAAALISATLMQQWNPPPGVTSVIIFADKDRPGPDGQEVGRKAAIALGRNLAERGIHGNILFPSMEIPQDYHSADWNDVLMLGGYFPTI